MPDLERRYTGQLCRSLYRDLAADGQTKGVRLGRRVAQLAEGNAELGHPTGGIDAGRGVPHCVPRDVFVGVVENRDVALDARGIDRELEAAALVVVRVDQDLDLVGRGALIAASQERLDAVRMRVQ